MTDEKYKLCTSCKRRHPISEFSPGQAQCKKARSQNQKDVKKRKVSLPVSHTKKYSRCGHVANGLKEVKKKFNKDNSRPDHFQPHCKICDNSRVGRVTPKIYTEYLTGKTKQFRDRLLRTILRFVKDEERSIARQLVEDFKHEKEDISFVGREWQIQILNDFSPEVVSRKPSQMGLTWLLERFVIALLMRYNEKPYRYKDHAGNVRNRFLEAIYSFETATKASSWSKVRLEKVKMDNPFIRDALKMGKSDSTLLMQFGRTALYLVGRTTVSGVTTISADIVIVDEKDRDQNPDISTQIGSRTLESNFMNTHTTKGIKRTTSTPEVGGAGISLLMENSNYYEWAITCSKCETEQIMTYPECIGNFYERGDDQRKDEKGNTLVPYWKCMLCHEPIDWKDIGQWSQDDPDHFINCRWIPRHPEKYDAKTGKGIVGYQVPFATANRSAAFFLDERDNPERDIKYLYNHLLGLPYDDETKTLTANNFKKMGGIQWGYSGPGRYVMGCDHHPAQGGFITIFKFIDESTKPTKPEGKWTLVYLEHVKNNKLLYDSLDNSGQLKKGRLYELMLEYGIDVCVADLEPDTNEVEKLIKEFSLYKKFWADKSGNFQDTFKFIEEEMRDGEPHVVCRIYEDKVAMIDNYFNRIRFGDLLFPDEEYKQGYRLRKQFIESHTNMYKGEVTESEKLARQRLAASNLKEVYKKRQAGIVDHWAMSGKFASVAIKISFQANRTMSGIAPPSIRGMSRIPGT